MKACRSQAGATCWISAASTSTASRSLIA